MPTERPVIMYRGREPVALYHSIKAAAEIMNGHKSGIVTACLNAHRKYKGHYWRYAEARPNDPLCELWETAVSGQSV